MADVELVVDPGTRDYALLYQSGQRVGLTDYKEIVLFQSGVVNAIVTMVQSLSLPVSTNKQRPGRLRFVDGGRSAVQDAGW